MAVVGDGGGQGGRLEALVADGRQVHAGHVVLVDVNGRLVLAAARLVRVRPVVGAVISFVGEVVEWFQDSSLHGEEAGGGHGQRRPRAAGRHRGASLLGRGGVVSGAGPRWS